MVATEAVCLLAGTPPWDLKTEMLAGLYRRVLEMRAEPGIVSLSEMAAWQDDARHNIIGTLGRPA